MSSTADHQIDPRRFVVRPTRHGMRFSCFELWEYRELLMFLAWRDIKVRYKQTVIGVAWSVLQPLLMMIAFTVFFGRLGGVRAHGVPYAIFTYVAILPWQLFSHALLASSVSLVANQDLVKKVYFPRILIPIASLSVGLVNFGIALVALVIMMAISGIEPHARLLFVVPFLVLAVIASLGVGFFFSALNARYRDVQLALPFLTQIWLFATPVIYPSSLIPEPWQPVYALNPMVGVVDGFRWSFLGVSAPPPAMMFVSLVTTLIIFVIGLCYFLRTQETIADVI